MPGYVQAHIQNMMPLINQANQEVQDLRSRVVKIVELGDQASSAQTTWLDRLMTSYNSPDTDDLLKKLDTVPPSLAVAQSALESHWGQDIKARLHNVFFGQIGGQRGGYAHHASQLDAVRSYIRNLNSHPAYAGLRNLRAQIRQRGQTPTGLDLARGLERYSTTGDYGVQVKNMINSFGIKSLDKAS